MEWTPRASNWGGLGWLELEKLVGAKEETLWSLLGETFLYTWTRIDWNGNWVKVLQLYCGHGCIFCNTKTIPLNHSLNGMICLSFHSSSNGNKSRIDWGIRTRQLSYGLYGIRWWPLNLGELGSSPRLMTNVSCVHLTFMGRFMVHSITTNSSNHSWGIQENPFKFSTNLIGT
jgi:hypothetical protein